MQAGAAGARLSHLCLGGYERRMRILPDGLLAPRLGLPLARPGGRAAATPTSQCCRRCAQQGCRTGSKHPLASGNQRWHARHRRWHRSTQRPLVAAARLLVAQQRGHDHPAAALAGMAVCKTFVCIYRRGMRSRDGVGTTGRLRQLRDAQLCSHQRLLRLCPRMLGCVGALPCSRQLALQRGGLLCSCSLQHMVRGRTGTASAACQDKLDVATTNATQGQGAACSLRTWPDTSRLGFPI